MKRLILLVILLALGFYVGWPAYSGYQLQAALERKDVDTVGRKIDFPSVRKSLEPVVTREVGAGMDRYLGELGPVANIFGPVLKTQYGPKVVEATINTLITPENIVRIYAEKDDVQGAAERIVMEELNKPTGLFSGLFGGSKSSDGGPSLTDRMKLPGGMGGFGESLQGKLGGIAGGGAAAGIVGEMPDLKTALTRILEKRRSQRPAKSATEAAAAKPAAGGFGVSNIKHFGFNGPLAMEVGVAASGASTKPDFSAEMAFKGTDWKLTRLVPGS